MTRQKKVSFVMAMVIALSVLMISAVSAFALADAAMVTLAVDADSFAADKPVIIHVTLTNPTRHTLKVLKWATPADGIEDRLLSVRRDGVPVSYIGPLFKRPRPVSEDYIQLKAGRSVTFDMDLATGYDLSVSGNYSIIYDAASLNLYSEKGNGKKDADRLTSNEIKVAIAARKVAPPPPVEPPPPGVTGTSTFSGCTTTQQTALLKARGWANVYAADASSYMNAGSFDSRYITWFGAFDTTRYSTVTSNYSSIAHAMDTANVTFDCTCKKNYYAYVYATDPYKIYLCRFFWTVSPTGTDSQAGTLVHEMSHFDTTALTADISYGQANAKNLALSSPEQAIFNADNYEYFAENTPHLP